MLREKLLKILEKECIFNTNPIYSISIIGTVYLFIYSLLHIYRKEFFIATIEALLVAFSIFNLVFYKKTKNKELTSNTILLVLIAFFDYLIVDGGLYNTGIHWIYFYPTLAFFLKDKMKGIYWNFAFVFSILCLIYVQEIGFLKLAYSTNVLIFSLVTYSSIFIILIFIKSNINYSYSKVKKLATIDSLTGIFNRFQIMKLLNMEIERAKRYRKIFSVILFDIDNFKCINDTYGHQKGDEVLKNIAELFKENIRKTDYFGRFGGEEFIIIVPEATAREAYMLAEKLRKLLEKSNFDKDIKVTASFGITQYDCKKSITQLLKEADDALYMAKREGKNKVKIYDGKGCLEAP